jgi:solute carrier family 25 oxoglutarate transporter 11
VAVTAQVVASGTCGLVSALTSAPINVVRTRLMNNPAIYKGMVDCGVQLVRGEGVAALYKGFLPTLQRQVIFNAIFWVCLEEVQRVLGQKRL